jgi:2-polyprenyl-3-methyl-5-hydroxy-6-metoxy-1,4-benzoquinol methylase
MIENSDRRRTEMDAKRMLRSSSSELETLGSRGSELRSEPESWSHNLHDSRSILAAVAEGSRRALDVGCGKGALTRQLRSVVPEVMGIDRDERSIELARAHPEAADIEYVRGDFLALSFEPESFDLVTSVASLHHMEIERALQRMCDLLRPGGALAVVGLARGGSPVDVALNVPAVIGTRLHLVASAHNRRRRATVQRTAQTYQSPVIRPPPASYQDMRRLAGRILPGARYRRHLYWRYSLVWTKPT